MFTRGIHAIDVPLIQLLPMAFMEDPAAGIEHERNMKPSPDDRRIAVRDQLRTRIERDDTGSASPTLPDGCNA
jgi:hypothetical protein